MDNYKLANAVRVLAGGSSLGLGEEFKDKEKAKLILNYFLISLSKNTGVSIEELLEDHVMMLKPIEEEPKKNSLGYGTSFSSEVYEELDNLIRKGFSNRVIAEKLGIHPNTVTNRRKKINV